MATIVDFHVHVFADTLGKWISKMPPGPLTHLISSKRMEQYRKRTRTWMKPIAGSLHSVQTTLRYLPEFLRRNIDEVSGIVSLPGLLVESTPSDLVDAMDEAGIQYAVIIAQPPFISNEFIMEVSAHNPRFIPAVSIPKGTSKPGSVLKSYASRGAKVLKIHAAFEGEGPESPRYRALLKAASDMNMPIILHTGCLHGHLFYKNPLYGRAEIFSNWYETYSHTKFILAHMNFHDPDTALDLCEEFGNVFVDTSWQPAEVIGEAVRRIGADRVLFGTDWPFVGNNLMVGRKRVQDCVDTGLLNEEQSKLILGENAFKLLGLTVHAH